MEIDIVSVGTGLRLVGVELREEGVGVGAAEAVVELVVVRVTSVGVEGSVVRVGWVEGMGGWVVGVEVGEMEAELGEMGADIDEMGAKVSPVERVIYSSDKGGGGATTERPRRGRLLSALGLVCRRRSASR